MANKGLKGLYSTPGKSNQAFRGLLRNFHLLWCHVHGEYGCGMLVGMIGFQLFNALMTSVQASMQGNQEMRAYFKTLKYTTAEVESITRALDKMGNKFKKINKYAVGSIIANVATQAGLKAEEAEAMVEPAALVYAFHEGWSYTNKPNWQLKRLQRENLLGCPGNRVGRWTL